jgi:hypothetical protein
MPNSKIQNRATVESFQHLGADTVFELAADVRNAGDIG